MTPQSAEEKSEKKMIRGSFAASLVVHGIILLIIGSIVIVPGAVQKFMPVTSVPAAPPDIPQPPKMEESAPMDQSPDPGGSPISDQPQEAVGPAQDTVKDDALVMDMPSTMAPRMDASSGVSSAVSSDLFKQGGGQGGSGGGTGAGIGKGMTFFGTTEKLSSALVGTFYDLKQTPGRMPTVFASHPWDSERDCEPYFEVQERFVQAGWDDAILDRYYHTHKPLYATQFWMAQILSSDAPKAFGVEKDCKGGFWLAHYKGRVVPPHDGTYRFVGIADCQIIVAVNKKLALVSAWWPDALKNLGLDCPIVGNKWGESGMSAGPWFHLTTSEPVTLDILWGDNGGACSCFLQVEEKGAKYEMENGHPILPIFQLAPMNTPVQPRQATTFATDFTPWKGVK